MYPLDLTHNHGEDPNLKEALPSTVMASRNQQVALSTAQEQPSASESTASDEENAAAVTIVTEDEQAAALQFKEKMKLRLAAIVLDKMKK